MLGNAETRIFLNVTEGKIAKRTDGGRIMTFDYVEGEIERIFAKDREFRGEKVPYYYVDLRDPKSGELYSLGLRSASGVWRSLILSLGSITNFLLPVKINPYRKGDYDRVAVYQGDQRIDWISDLPPVEEIEVQGQKVKSTAKRDEYISNLVKSVNDKLGVEKESRPGTGKTSPRQRAGRLSVSDLLGD